MSAREQLVALLEANLPVADDAPDRVIVLPFASQIDPPSVQTVMPRLDNVLPGVTLGARRYVYALVLLSRHAAIGKADVELEDLLELVCEALVKVAAQGMAVEWETAKRGTYAQKVPAIEIAVTVHVSITPPEEPTP